MSETIVVKFGGAALADGPSVRKACALVAAVERPVVVVSAHLGVTALLERAARAAVARRAEGPLTEGLRIRHRTLLRQLALDPEPLDRYVRELDAALLGIAHRGELRPGDLDHVLAFGERMSARIVAWSLRREGVPAMPVDAFDLGLVTDSNHGAARPLPGKEATVRCALDALAGVPVVTGFLARDVHGNLTTLGRNGSDLTAALLAEAASAVELRLYKAVSGILSADPQVVPDARPVDRLSYAEAEALAFFGADVLHPASVEPARRAGVPVRILDVRRPDAPGTSLGDGPVRPGPVAVTGRADVTLLRAALSEEHKERDLARLFDALATAGVDVLATTVLGSRVRVFVAGGSARIARAIRDLADAQTVEHDRDLALLALVGGDVDTDRDVAARVRRTLAAAHLTLEDELPPFPAARAFAVPAKELAPALRAVHAAFVPGTAERVV